MLAKVIRPSFHFHQDNVVASILVIAPQFLPLTDWARILSSVSGVYLFAYNALTDRPGSLARLLSEDRIHRFLDLVGIALLLVLPWILFSTTLDRMYFFLQGIITLILVMFIDFTPQTPPRPRFFKNAMRYLFYTTTAFIGVLVMFIIASRAMQ